MISGGIEVNSLKIRPILEAKFGGIPLTTLVEINTLTINVPII